MLTHLIVILTLHHFCTGSLCNSQCPDRLILGQLSSNNWHLGIKLFIVVLVIIIAVFCFLVKLAFTFWLYQLEKKLNNYLQSLHKAGSPNHAILQVSLAVHIDIAEVE